MNTHRSHIACTVAVAAFVSISPAMACHDGSPLILDLNGDGIITTDFANAVAFDINGDGSLETLGWTFWLSEEAFLVLDRNHNGLVDDGTELFGDATALPSGELAEHGFEALAAYDLLEFGGNGDGMITKRDAVWKDLRLWIDENHDAISQSEEIHKLHKKKVEALGLDFVATNELSGSGNVHRFQGFFVKKVKLLGEWFHQAQQMDDVFFKIQHDQP